MLEVDDEFDETGSILSVPPPKHLTVTTEIDGMVPVTTIRYRRVDPIAFFLIPFTCVWAGGSMSGIYGSQILRRTFDLKLSLFGIPFLIGSIGLVVACLFMLFGRRVLTLSAGHGSYFTGVVHSGERAASHTTAIRRWRKMNRFPMDDMASR